MAVSNVVVEKENQLKPEKFVLNHDLNTTYAWGEIQPLQCQLLPMAGVKTKFRVSNTLRMFPLVSPTYGTVAYKNYHSFVSFDDIFPKWRQMFSDVKTFSLNYDSTTTEKISWDETKIVSIPTISSSMLWYFMSKYMYAIPYSRAVDTQTSDSDVTAEWSPVTGTAANGLSSYLNLATGFVPNSLTNLHMILGADGANNVTLNGILRHPAYFAPTEADFTYFIHRGNGSSDIMATYKLSPAGKRLYKIIHGAGYYVDPNCDTTHSVNQSILPLLAIYKAYYDSFGLPQYENWETTNCYALIEYFSHNFPSGSTHVTNSINPSSELYSLLDGFFTDLSELWYTDNSSYASMHYGADDVPNSQQDWTFPSGLSTAVIDHSSHTYGTDTTSNTTQLGNTYTSASPFNQFTDEMLKKAYLWINKSSAVGMDIEEQLKIRGYEDYCKSCGNRYIGATTSYLDIHEVTAQSDTAELTNNSAGRVLGSPAGRGVSFDANKYFHFTSDSPGYIISLGCIVPMSKDIQTIDTTLLGTDIYSFYNPMFDAVGFETTPRCAIGGIRGTQHTERTDDVPNAIFGMVPRYTGFKVKNSLLNGGFNLRPELSAYLPYTLDRIIYESFNNMFDYNSTSGKFKSNDIEGGFNVNRTGSYDPATKTWTGGTNDTTLPFPNAGRIWRRTMSQKLFGNLDRVFNQLAYNDWQHPNQSSYIDTFICHHAVDFEMIAKMLPVSKTWGTLEDPTEKTHADVVDK